jgi:DNA-binding transcriptional LysR family regulator
VATDPLANAQLVAAGLAVTLTPRLLCSSLPGVVIVDVVDAPRRRVYAVSPARGRHPLAAPFIDAMRASA